MPRQVTVKFAPEFTALLESDRKISTTRYQRLGHKADYFEWNGHKYVIDHVQAHHLRFVARHFFREEGFATMQEFIRWWIAHYSCRGYHSQEIVFYHRFFRET